MASLAHDINEKNLKRQRTSASSTTTSMDLQWISRQMSMLSPIISKVQQLYVQLMLHPILPFRNIAIAMREVLRPFLKMNTKYMRYLRLSGVDASLMLQELQRIMVPYIQLMDLMKKVSGMLDANEAYVTPGLIPAYELRNAIMELFGLQQFVRPLPNPLRSLHAKRGREIYSLLINNAF